MKISVSKAVLTWYNSAQRTGVFGLYDLLEFVRNTVGRQVMDSALTADCRRLRRQKKINYYVVDDSMGLYEFMPVGDNRKRDAARAAAKRERELREKRDAFEEEFEEVAR